MKIYALQTARKNSESVVGKNLLPIKGKPLFLHNIHNALASRHIAEVFVSTDDPVIKQHASEGFRVIDRPESLGGSEVPHWDVIMHGLGCIEQTIAAQVDILVILLGNSLGSFTSDLDAAIEILLNDEHLRYDSVQSMSEFNMFNPFRACHVDRNGLLDTIIPQDFIVNNKRHENSNDKRVAGDTYFFNGSFWVCRRDAVVRNEGLLPFPWLGKRIVPFIQHPGIQELDASWQKICLEAVDEICAMPNE